MGDTFVYPHRQTSLTEPFRRVVICLGEGQPTWVVYDAVDPLVVEAGGVGRESYKSEAFSGGWPEWPEEA